MSTTALRNRKSNGSGAALTDASQAKQGDFILLHRPDRISAFLKSWRHRGREGVQTSAHAEPERRWRYILSQVFLDLLWLVRDLLLYVGTCVEMPGNVWKANGSSLWQVVKRVMTLQLVIPDKESVQYHSLISQLDPRTKLWADKSAVGTPTSEAATSEIFPGNEAGARSTADVLVMASKLAYENAAVIEHVVTNDWKMKFEGFYTCWNEFLKQNNTQVFLFTDRDVDANAIVIAWRGTEPFNAMDWSTDLDFSWYHLHGMGNVHVGFLEALGLASRDSVESLKTLQHKSDAKYENTMQKEESTSGLNRNVIEDPSKVLAYDEVTMKVKDLMVKHPDAKVYTTGHSLGGALAALYTGMIYYNGETSITEKLAAVYTFGQPRVGDEKFAKFMRKKLPASKYFRVVYCNDIIPRVPFDDQLFAFKHFGLCLYYNSRYKIQCLAEAPQKNYFYLSDVLAAHVTALGELYSAFRPADPEFAESWQSLLFRVAALLVPGVGGHSPVNYVNAVRLGPAPLLLKLTEGIHEIDHTLHEWEEKGRSFIYKLFHRSVTPP